MLHDVASFIEWAARSRTAGAAGLFLVGLLLLTAALLIGGRIDSAISEARRRRWARQAPAPGRHDTPPPMRTIAFVLRDGALYPIGNSNVRGM